jgi:hypothetical protein
MSEHDRDRFRGRCALALDANAKITRELANAIRVSPMQGCVDLGAIEACRKYASAMLRWLDQAEESARAVQAAEKADSPHAHEWGQWQDDPVGVVRACPCGAFETRPEG